MSTSPGFEPLLSARFHVEVVDGAEVFVIPAGRNWLAIPFILFWLTMWTVGGVATFWQFLSGNDQVFLAIWLVGWAVGWMFAASWLAWQIGGRTMLTVKDGALCYSWKMPLWSTMKRYEAAQIRNLGTAEMPWSFALGSGMLRNAYPPFFPMQTGTIKFDYGARTVRIAPGLNEAEGRQIVGQLRSKLPTSAFSG